MQSRPTPSTQHGCQCISPRSPFALMLPCLPVSRLALSKGTTSKDIYQRSLDKTFPSKCYRADPPASCQVLHTQRSTTRAKGWQTCELPISLTINTHSYSCNPASFAPAQSKLSSRFALNLTIFFLDNDWNFLSGISVAREQIQCNNGSWVWSNQVGPRFPRCWLENTKELVCGLWVFNVACATVVKFWAWGRSHLLAKVKKRPGNVRFRGGIIKLLFWPKSSTHISLFWPHLA